jgi:prepilin-type N-terminal cleavage/methylation domain-containing protein
MIHHKQQQPSLSSQSGFTIVESLVAIVVVAILLAAIAPVIILSVGTRVQAKRVELATDAAKTYIDGVRSAKIAAPAISTNDNPPPAPSGTLSCPTTGSAICSISPASTLFQLYCVDADTGGCTNNNSKDMIIQAFGYNANSTNASNGYRLGLRVYRADAFQSGITLKASPNIKQQKSFTGGSGLSPIQAPLLETSTEISNNSTTFSNFCDRLKNEDNSQSQC